MVGVTRIARIRLNVAHVAAASDFYITALGFEVVRPRVLRLGAQELELVQAPPEAQPYPAPRSAADPWFQHFAIVVSDMPRAYAHLQGIGGWRPISDGGPQRLPPSTGAVTAFKFRDPDGHPLELSFFPTGVGAPQWRQPCGERMFLGIDHSALAVSHLEHSVAFYRNLLGLRIASTLVNAGPTQAKLDDLPDPVVDIVAAFPPSGPHVELLAYRTPRPPAARPFDSADLVATQLVLKVQELVSIVSHVEAFGGRLIERHADRVALVADPDGHFLRIEAS